MTDPISDMLSRIRNAVLARKANVEMPSSRSKFAIAKILEKEGFVEHAEILEKALKPTLKIVLKYVDPRTNAISEINRVSKPGRRVYAKADELPRVRFGQGFAIVSTPNGMMSSNEARKRHLGGEIICEVF